MIILQDSNSRWTSFFLIIQILDLTDNYEVLISILHSFLNISIVKESRYNGFSGSLAWCQIKKLWNEF